MSWRWSPIRAWPCSAGLNVIPKKSYLSRVLLAHRVTPQTTRLLAACQQQIAGEELLPGRSFNLDFHSVPYYGEHPVVERHYVSMRSRRQSSILTFLAQDADGHAFCYANADLRKGEEAERDLALRRVLGEATTASAPATWCSTRSSPPTPTWPGSMRWASPS